MLFEHRVRAEAIPTIVAGTIYEMNVGSQINPREGAKGRGWCFFEILALLVME